MRITGKFIRIIALGCFFALNVACASRPNVEVVNVSIRDVSDVRLGEPNPGWSFSLQPDGKFKLDQFFKGDTVRFVRVDLEMSDNGMLDESVWRTIRRTDAWLCNGEIPGHPSLSDPSFGSEFGVYCVDNGCNKTAPSKQLMSIDRPTSEQANPTIFLNVYDGQIRVSEPYQGEFGGWSSYVHEYDAVNKPLDICVQFVAMAYPFNLPPPRRSKMFVIKGEAIRQALIDHPGEPTPNDRPQFDPCPVKIQTSH